MIKKGLKLNNNQKGLTLIESLVVVGILLGIVAVALTLYGTVRDRLNVKNESENASVIYSQLVDLYSDEPTGTLTAIGQAVDSGIIPKKMSITGTSPSKVVTDSWGGKVTLKGVGTTGFELTFPRVPSMEVCVSFVKNQKKVGWDEFTVGTTKVVYSASTNASITKACKKAGASDYVSVMFARTDI